MSSGEEEEKPKPVTARPPGGMSRFLRTAGSDSSSSDSDQDDDDDDDDDEDDKTQKKKKSKFTFDGSDDEGSDDDTRRVVKSAKDKRVEEMESMAKAMENALKINDWVAISNGMFPVIHAWKLLIYKFFLEFDKLGRLVQRQTNAAERVPAVFLKSTTSLEGSVNAAIAKEKEAKKKMNVANAKALTAMKQKVKKAQKEYEVPMKTYLEVSWHLNST